MKISSKKSPKNRPPDLDSLKLKGSSKQKVDSNGFLWRMTSPVREWRELPHTIQACSPKSQKQLDLIDEMLIDYRLTLMKTNHVAKNVNQKIWDSYQLIKKKNETLFAETNKRALFLHSNKYLRNLLEKWNDLLSTQDDLMDVISRAPASLKFYNMMITYKEIRQQERLDDENNERRYNEAYGSLESALEYVEEYISKKENKFLETSRVLSIDDARNYWSDQLAEINELQKSGRSDIDNILIRLNTLKNTIFEAPPISKWIYDVEQQYFRLVDDHQLLNNMYGKSIIHPEELQETNILMSEMIPKLWVAGENEQLNHYLKQIETFIKSYEMALQEELAYQERHSPWAGIGKEGTGDELTMLNSFVRIMINAIESRESHMGDHSVTVAQLSRNTADELNWSERELEYLEVAGLLHDVGKIWIPETLLTKPGPLTENEFEVIRLHPFYSAKIVESISALKEIVPWVYYHHERWDGKGYPESLRQSEIPLGASIIAVAEAFSSMIFNRLSREPLTIDEAFEQIRMESGKQFDPDVTEAFITAASKMRSELDSSKVSGFSSPI